MGNYGRRCKIYNYWSTSGIKNSKSFPNNYNILKTYPNPFNPSINIEVQSTGELITDIAIISLMVITLKIFLEEKFLIQYKISYGNQIIFQVEFILLN